ncbi:MAG: response regulator [Bacteroidota bacterium]|nr:response regulator [Bacteroidota bacterium]MDP4191375.1 response regulator [Bacteroidota bacterium]MDP4194317.1 response regulator [Bacteroidota bacterium]
MEKILIVDDSPDITTSLSDLLKECGYYVYSAHCVEQGFSLAKQVMPDLILSDILMPKTDGYEFLKMLKEEEKTSNIPVIFISAKAEKSESLKSFEAGVCDFILKPYDAKGLLKIISEIFIKAPEETS